MTNPSDTKLNWFCSMWQWNLISFLLCWSLLSLTRVHYFLVVLVLNSIIKKIFFLSPCSGLFIKKKKYIVLGNKIINCCTKQLYCEYFTLTKASYLVLLLHIGHIMHCFVLVWQELMWILKYFKGCAFQNDKILNWSSFPLEFVVNDKII